MITEQLLLNHSGGATQENFEKNHNNIFIKKLMNHKNSFDNIFNFLKSWIELKV